MVSNVQPNSAALPPLSRTELLAALTPFAREVADVIGLEAALQLCRHFGGTRIYVARSGVGQGFERAASVAGKGAALALAARMGSRHLEFPTLHRLALAVRNRVLLAEFDAGVTKDELVDRYRMTRRHVTKLVSGRPRAQAGGRLSESAVGITGPVNNSWPLCFQQPMGDC
jgi:hypothetical protein